MGKRLVFYSSQCAFVIVTVFAMFAGFQSVARADITCYDFWSQAEAQSILDAMPHDPYGLDSGWPLAQDQEAGNGVACDSQSTLPDNESPGNEKYTINDDSSKNGRNSLPKQNIEQATVQTYIDGAGVQTIENPDKIYTIMSIQTPEYEQFADYEEAEVPGQCSAYEATQRLYELLAPGTTIWLEIDEAGFFTQTELDRHVWVELNGRYRLVSEILVSQGLAAVATERPGTGRADAASNPPSGSFYRDALRRAQTIASSNRIGIWGAC